MTCRIVALLPCTCYTSTTLMSALDLRQHDSPSGIRTLPPLLVNQIAAGEVVERPASVVKELVDNAIDAGAARIALEIEKGGVELVRVSDDGAGLPPQELPLAIAPHATSKLREAADLARIATMGFRGEALASIASVSRLSIRSRTRTAEGAHRIDVEGDAITQPRPEAGPVGTVVTVRNLFFNTPARRKFLRTSQTEQGHCLDTLRALALAHPRIGFTATCDGRTVVDLAPEQSPRDRALAILGTELAGKLIEVSSDGLGAGDIALWGMVGLPEIARPTAKGQRFFINGRPIADRSIQHALQEGYRGLIDPGRKPMAVLMLEMDPASVDVNVHPAKAEVRFRDSGLVHSVVLRAVRDALRSADLTPKWSNSGAGGAGPRPEFGDGLPPAPESNASGFTDRFTTPQPAAAAGRFDYQALRDAVAKQRLEDAEPLPLPTPRRADSVLQVHNSYLVTQDEHGVVIIDQHAMHERFMFEQIMQRLGEGALESQQLLTPAVVKTTAQRIERLEELKPLLTRLGVEAAPLGPSDIAIHAFPSFLFEKRVDPAEFLEELLERAEDGDLTGATAEESAVHEIVDMMACKAAVKAGDHLTDEEVGALLNMRERYERASNCPHGRPTTIRLTIRDLEKQFGRT
ncbi:MAG: DNA mismatch repair endonuclease MutL [Phycisphaeraceae bacterium]|nr:MAG: DNA mismatch repair endonuclease MutL [Phycisphaeraceae bacterium]